MRTVCWLATLAVAGLVACDNSQGAGPARGPSRDGGETECRGDNCADADDPDAAFTDTVDPDTTTADSGPDNDVADLGTGECAVGSVRCSSTGLPQECRSGRWIDLDTCPGGQICLAGTCTPGAICEANSVFGCSSETAQFVCNAEGNAYIERACADGLFCLDGSCGDIRCHSGDRRCLDDFTIEECDATGLLWEPAETCDRRAVRVCSDGECVSGCVAFAKDPSYIGCEYWSLDLPQFLADPSMSEADRRQPHSVVVANVSDYAAEVTVTTTAPGIVVPDTLRVDPGATGVLTLPRLDVDDTTRTRNSYRINSTEPIIAYQFNPLNNVSLFSNDASLLLPVNAVGREYYVMAWPGGVEINFPGIPAGEAQRGYMTVLASAPGTTNVTITFTTEPQQGDTAELQGITAGTTRTFTLEQWEVLNFDCDTVFRIPVVECDFTGTHITSDKAVTVFAGHEEAVIGEDGEDGNCCADRLEEQLFPVSAWGTRYLAVHSPPRGTEPDYWRVVASRNGTSIATNPAISGLNGITLNAGQFVQVNTPQSFEIEATQPIMVGQFLASQQSAGVTSWIGDPSFILSVPSEQFRDNYLLLTPENYDSDYITFVRPAGAEIILDGVALSNGAFTAFGTRTYEYAHIAVEPGAHRATSSQPFGVYAYGYDGAVSYGLPGGLNLGDYEATTPIP